MTEPNPKRLSIRSGASSSGEPDLQALREILAEMPVAVLLLDRDGSVALANRAAQQLLAVPRAELVRSDFFRRALPKLEEMGIGPRYRADMRPGPLLDLVADLEVGSAEGERPLHVRVLGAPREQNRHGIVVLEDRSLVRSERERRERAERMAVVGELARGVAHEVNNPLASIKSFAQLIRLETKEESHLQALEIISQECSRVSRTVDGLLDFAHRQEVDETGVVEISGLVEEVLELKRYALETAGVAVEVDLDAEAPPVYGSIGALQRALMHLLLSAEHALSNRREEKRLIVRTREATDGVSITVQDNGAGIRRAELRTLFDPMRSTLDPTVRFGLAVVDSVVRDHGGHFSVESVEGRGTTYLIRLPRAPQDRSPRSVDAHVAPAPASPASSRPLRVLVADDEPALRLALELFLSRRGHEVVQAASAREALEIARERTLDVALVDARMPGDGGTLVDELERMEQLSGRVALMSGDVGYIRDARLEHPERLYLTKPFEMTEVVRLVEEMAE